MTDRYENIRLALAMEPMPGPWLHDDDGVTADDEDVAVAMCCPSEAEAAYIAACDPDTIRELLAERDQLAAALEAAQAERDAMREALKDADNELDWLDEDVDTCDHSVGVCMCSYWGMRRKMKAALAKESSND